MDTLIVVPNQKLLSFGEQKETMQNSFKLVDKVLYEVKILRRKENL